MISAWSYSRLVTFEQCPYRAKLAFIDKIPEPERPLPPGKTEHANDRGTRIHTAAERFVRGEQDLAPELVKFAQEFTDLRAAYLKGTVSLEGDWGHDRAWQPVAWMSPEVWCRVKLDAFVRANESTGIIVDYKTGKKSGNEVKHAEQGQLYSVSAFHREPELEILHVEFWYTDQDDMTKKTYTREDATRFEVRFTDRGRRLTEATDFPPRPNKFTCKWCPYSPKGSGHCAVGVT